MSVPTYSPAMRGNAYVVRRFGVRMTHLAEWPGDLQVGEQFGASFYAMPTPVATLCGSVLQDSLGAVVVLREPVTVQCRLCNRSVR